MKKILIYGSGGFGREVVWLIERINFIIPKWEIVGFVDDIPENKGMLVNNYKVLGSKNILDKMDKICIVLAIGNSIAREKIIFDLKKFKNLEYPNIIDPSVIYSDYLKLGVGNIICANSILTTNIEIGSYNIINLDCTIGHDVIVEDFVTILPGNNISGNCTIKKGAELGSSTTIIPKIVVGEYSIIGAGGVVINNIPDKCTAVGVPAKIIKS